jgi:hypothetical protein
VAGLIQPHERVYIVAKTYQEVKMATDMLVPRPHPRQVTPVITQTMFRYEQLRGVQPRAEQVKIVEGFDLGLAGIEAMHVLRACGVDWPKCDRLYLD